MSDGRATNKARTAGVSASSFLDLQAELAKQEDEFARNKANGKSRSIVGGVKRPEKKISVWAKQNKGVHRRNARDVEMEKVSQPTLESARAALERKAAVYEKLRRGKGGGLKEHQYDALLVDFDQKAMDQGYESNSADEDESLTVPRAPLAHDDPVMEYEDEFGRIRTAPRSEIPRNLLPKQQQTMDEEPDDFDPYVIRNATDHFPVYEQAPERLAQLAKEAEEADNPLAAHYDSTREIRNKGAAFYRFSGDEEQRAQQMAELKTAREETERTRKDLGAEDVGVGEVEGMRAGEGESGRKVVSKAMEKRRRDLEERRKKIEEARAKGKGGLGQPADDFASVKASPLPTISASLDPFATLEACSQQSPQHQTSKQSTNADDFLANLEKEMLASSRS